MNEVPVKYIAPSKYDVAKFGTFYKVVGDNESYKVFVQLSEDLEVADWKPIGELIENTFKDFLTEKDFVSLCVQIHANKGDRKENFKSLAKLLVK